MKESSTSLRTLNHFGSPFVDAPPPSFASHLFFIFLTTRSTAAWCLPLPGWIHAFSQSTASSSETQYLLLASALPFDLISLSELS